MMDDLYCEVKPSTCKLDSDFAKMMYFVSSEGLSLSKRLANNLCAKVSKEFGASDKYTCQLSGTLPIIRSLYQSRNHNHTIKRL